MKKLIILSLSLLSVSCAQASDYGAKIFSDKVMFFDLFNRDPNPQVKVEESAVKVEESAEDMKQAVIRQARGCNSGSHWAALWHQELLISKYIKRCLLEYDKRSDIEQCSASAIVDIAVRMKQNGFSTCRCDRALDKLKCYVTMVSNETK